MIYRKNLPSTNGYCSSLIAKKKLPEGTIIYTDFQTAGRGQPGNTWESEANKNLLFSIILYPIALRAQNQFIISKTISLGISDCLERYLRDVFIKWPNDIYVNNDKIAGILIENSIIGDEIEHMIVGVGLNVNQEEFTSGVPNPTSLKILSCADFDLAELLPVISKDLDRRYKQLLYNKISEIDKEYVARLWRFKKWSRFQDSTGNFDGRILSVDDTGKLQIEDRQGKIHGYAFKEVEFL